MAPNMRVVKSPEGQVWQFDLNDPKEAAAYAEADSVWNGKPRVVPKPGGPALGSPELRKQVEAQTREMIPAGGAGVGSLVGGMGGGMLAGPWGARIGSALGSAAGGAIGAGSIGQDPKAAAGEWAAADVGGQALHGLLRGAGRGMMRSAINPPEWISRNFPGTWRTALREGVGVGGARSVSEGPEAAGVVEKMLGNKTGSTGVGATEQLLQRADMNVQKALSRVPGKPLDLARDVLPIVRKNLATGSIGRMPTDRAATMKEVDAILKQIATENPGAFDMARGHELKRGAQEISANLYEQLANARKSGSVIDQKSELKEKVMKELAGVLRARLGKDVPGYNAAEARVTDLMGLKRALKYREAMPSEGLGTRVGHAVYFDPMGLIPEHTRSTVARALYGPGAAAGRVAPYPIFPFLDNAKEGKK